MAGEGRAAAALFLLAWRAPRHGSIEPIITEVNFLAGRCRFRKLSFDNTAWLWQEPRAVGDLTHEDPAGPLAIG
jgi:hypothetical protein